MCEWVKVYSKDVRHDALMARGKGQSYYRENGHSTQVVFGVIAAIEPHPRAGLGR